VAMGPRSGWDANDAWKRMAAAIRGAGADAAVASEGGTEDGEAS
jgi:hypothetical protein